jgi:hypothetical protein
MSPDPSVKTPEHIRTVWITIEDETSEVTWFFSSIEERKLFMRKVIETFLTALEFRPVDETVPPIEDELKF